MSILNPWNQFLKLCFICNVYNMAECPNCVITLMSRMIGCDERHNHPCYRWDSNARSQCSLVTNSKQILEMPLKQCVSFMHDVWLLCGYVYAYSWILSGQDWHGRAVTRLDNTSDDTHLISYVIIVMVFLKLVSFVQILHKTWIPVTFI
jgi:hypothetical protein